MKNILLICSILASSLAFSQKTVDVKLKFTYNGNPLCNWEVTLKHGDVALGKGTTDKSGVVEFSSVTIISTQVDAYGYKKTANGDKKWDVKGYITLDGSNYGEMDFKKIVADAGMPASMLENAWGLTINDCGQVGQSTSSTPAKTDDTQSTTTGTTTSTPASKPVEEDPTLSPLENLQNQKAGLENKISVLDKKIEKKKAERSKLSETSSEYSSLSYEIRDLELDKEITKIKLERTDKLIEKGGTSFLNKEERQSFDSREDKFVAEQKELKQKEKSGIPFGGSAPVVAPTETPVENKEEKNSKENKTEDNKEEDVKKKSYDSAELAAMSTANLKKIKLENNSAITKRKMTLKTRSNFLTPQEKADLQLEIDDLIKQVELIDAELAKRSESEN
jgi:hypothetical protein